MPSAFRRLSPRGIERAEEAAEIQARVRLCFTFLYLIPKIVCHSNVIEEMRLS